jgi:hypothetical protein
VRDLIDCPKDRNAEFIGAQQNDVDHLMAYDSRGDALPMPVEARRVTSSTSKQMDSQVRLLVQIFGKDGKIWVGVVPHSVINSPRQPGRLNANAWPQWIAPSGRVPWLRLSVPAELKGVSRHDAQGERDATGRHRKAITRRC